MTKNLGKYARLRILSQDSRNTLLPLWISMKKHNNCCLTKKLKRYWYKYN